MLTVRIFSFSYKKSGIPDDPTSNMGGFVFDCRFVDNPGRKPEFMSMTGKDKAVIEFLDSNIEMQLLLDNVYNIINGVIDNYIRREFTDLMVCFGCTGGQHRSVYASEKLKNYLAHKYDSSMHLEIHHLDCPC
jgi:RNase adaptor protein for sRNA GlmZ degradation